MTETRETKIRERFPRITMELDNRNKYAFVVIFDHRRIGPFYQTEAQAYQAAFDIVYAAGREDALEDAARLFPEDKWEAVAKWIRSLSSKKDSETRMLRVLAERHGLMEFNDDDDKEVWPEASIMAFGSELLLAAKEKAAQIVEKEIRDSEDESRFGEYIRDSDFGDLFEVK